MQMLRLLPSLLMAGLERGGQGQRVCEVRWSEHICNEWSGTGMQMRRDAHCDLSSIDAEGVHKDLSFWTLTLGRQLTPQLKSNLDQGIIMQR